MCKSKQLSLLREKFGLVAAAMCKSKQLSLLSPHLALLLVGVVPTAPVVAVAVVELLVPNVTRPPFLLTVNAALERSNLNEEKSCGRVYGSLIAPVATEY